MNIFDIVGIASKVPFDLVQKLQADAPKIERLVALGQAAEPHVQALIPMEKEALAIYAEISPDVIKLLQALGVTK